MDRNSILAIVIITVILVTYPLYIEWLEPQSDPQSKKPETVATEVQRDSIERKSAIAPQSPAIDPLQKNESVQLSQAVLEDSNTVEIPLEGKYVRAILSNAGGGSLLSWQLKDFTGANGGSVEIIGGNGLSIEFNDWNGDFIDLSRYRFQHLETLETDSFITVRMQLPYREGIIERDFIFNKYGYELGLRVAFRGLRENFLGKQFTMRWRGGLPAAESQFQEDASYAGAAMNIGDDVERFSDAGDDGVTIEGNEIRWSAVRIKYFTAALLAENSEIVNAVRMDGKVQKLGETDYGRYGFGMRVKHQETDSENHFQLYMGPLNIDIMSAYDAGIEEMVLGSSGYERFFRPFSLAMLWVLKKLHTVIPNYGVAIIVFTLLLKLLLFPLTRSSYKSMKAMQTLKPEMDAIRKRYKDDPQALQKKTMEMYKENKVNPLGGCLPMLLQMPVLISLYIVFRSTVQLRGEPFFAWITDLSLPDTIINLPFTVPFYGDQISLLPILMAVSMFFQQRQTITDPTQKAMIYIFPVMMLVIFNTFPSGLNLYYTLFNVLSIAQQHFISANISGDKSASVKPRDKGLAVRKQQKK
jgi:YidC/Oxa1 family membrane protein insertase